ncbi:O-antigen polymerase [Synergistales bacterium]|nr:O-antigen polymerase [Synergistales bacterium]
MKRSLSIEISRIVAFIAAFSIVSLPVLVFNGHGWYPHTHLFKWIVTFPVVAYGAGSYAIMLLMKRGDAWLTRTDVAWLALILLFALQGAFIPVRNFSEWVRNWYFFAALGGAVFFLRMLTIDDALPAILRSVAVTGGVSVIIGFIQRFDPTAVRPFIFDIRTAQDRFAANTGLDNILGVYLALAVIGGCWLLIRRARISTSVIDILLLALNLVGIWMTGSRSALLSCAVGVMALLLALSPDKRQVKKIAACATMALAVIISAAYIAPDALKVKRRNMSDAFSLEGVSPIKEGRYTIWGISLEVIKTAPLFGVGLGNYKWNYMDAMAAFSEKTNVQPIYTYWAHNEYLQLIAEVGIAGGALFFILLLRYLWLAVSARPENLKREHSYALAWSFAAIVVLAVDSCFSRPFHRVDTAFTLSLAGALISKICDKPVALEKHARIIISGAIFLIAFSGVALFADSFSDQRYIGEYFYNSSYVALSPSSVRERYGQALILEDAYLQLVARENYKRARMNFGDDDKNNENYQDAVRVLSEYFKTEPRYDELNMLMLLYQGRGALREGEKYFKYYPKSLCEKFLDGEFDGKYMPDQS